MNWLDLAIIAICIPAAIGGFRLGLVARATSWLGFGIGLAASARFASVLADRSTSLSTNTVLVLAAVVLLAGGLIGQVIGLFAGTRLGVVVPPGWPQQLDRALGTAGGIAGVGLALWMALPIMQSVPDWPADQASGSALSNSVVRGLGSPPHTVSHLASVVGDRRWKALVADLSEQLASVDIPSDHGLSPEIFDRASRASVQIKSTNCGDSVIGSGFVVEGDYVITAAHVIAGSDSINVKVAGADGAHDQLSRATVLVYDPRLDLAVLQVPLAGLATLPLGAGRQGDRGGVFGFPANEGAGLQVQPFEVGLVSDALIPGFGPGSGTDKRAVLVLATHLAEGYSGGPVVSVNGEVLGTAFAVVTSRNPHTVSSQAGQDGGQNGGQGQLTSTPMALASSWIYLEDLVAQANRVRASGTSVATGPCIKKT